MPPTYTLSQIITQLQTSWGGSIEGQTIKWDASALTYSLPDTGPTNFSPYYGVPSEASGLVVMSSVMKDMARTAFELWDDLVTPSLTESTGSPAADITFNYSSATGGGSYASTVYLPSSSGFEMYAAQVWLDSSCTSHDQNSDMTLGRYGFLTYLHEIGHALGLSHPGTYDAGDGAITYATHAEFAQDNRQYTIMSYFGGYNTVTRAWTQDGTFTNHLYASTPMLYDVAAIQSLYGADLTTRAGDTIYGFGNTSGRAVFDFSSNTQPIVTIWDGGGVDTLDCSGYSANQIISLVAGTYSDIGGLVGNVAIAFNCSIEKAIGGSGNDRLTGNTVGNFLVGGSGSDVLIGGGGNDFLVGGRIVDQFAAGVQWSSVASNNWASGDFNGDGRADIFRYVTGTSGAQMFLSNGTSFQSAGSWTGAGLGNQGWVVGDFNGDGKDDVMRTIVGTGSQVFVSSGSAFVGNGTWTTATTDFWVAGDFNGDGRDDILRYVPASSGAEVHLSNGTGFSLAGSWTGAGRGSQGWVVGDFNGDGKDDLLRTITGSGTQVLLSNGSGFAGPVVWSTNTSLLRVGDFNNDGLSDVARVVGGNIEVLTSTGSGFTMPQVWGASNVSARYLRTGDFDGTGGDDIVSYTWIAGPRVHASTKLSGTDGSDTFVFTAASGSDTILDFVTSGPARDVLSFTTDVFSSLSQVLANATQVGANTIIRLDATDTLTLQNVTLSQLTSDNVLFV